MPATATTTPSHTRLNLWATWAMDGLALQALWFVWLDNVGNEPAYKAASFGTLRELAPLPGRAGRQASTLNCRPSGVVAVATPPKKKCGHRWIGCGLARRWLRCGSGQGPAVGG